MATFDSRYASHDHRDRDDGENRDDGNDDRKNGTVAFKLHLLPPGPTDHRGT